MFRDNPKLMAQRVAMAAVGIAMAMSLGLSDAGVASAAAPANKIKTGAPWTMEEKFNGACEHVFFLTATH